MTERDDAWWAAALERFLQTPRSELARSVAAGVPRSRAPILLAFPPDLEEVDSLAREAAAEISLALRERREASLTIAQRQSIEAVNLLLTRPSVPIRNHLPDCAGIPAWPTLGGPDGPVWTAIGATARATGRIDARTDGVRHHAGTGFLIAPDRVLTNNHVIIGLANALDTPRRRSDGLRFELGDWVRPEYDGLVAWLREEIDRRPHRAPVFDLRCEANLAESAPARVTGLEFEPGLDAALLTLAHGPLGGVPAPLLDRAPEASIGERVYTIGYPAVGSEETLWDVAARLLFWSDDREQVPDSESPRSVKRFAPGFVLGASATEVAHDASTLAGSSGSPIVHERTHAVLGLHAHGDAGTSNGGVRVAALRNSLLAGLGAWIER